MACLWLPAFPGHALTGPSTREDQAGRSPCIVSLPRFEVATLGKHRQAIRSRIEAHNVERVLDDIDADYAIAVLSS